MESVFRSLWLATQTMKPRILFAILPPGITPGISTGVQFFGQFMLVWNNDTHSTGLIYTKTIIHLSVGQ